MIPPLGQEPVPEGPSETGVEGMRSRLVSGCACEDENIRGDPGHSSMSQSPFSSERGAM